jgi:hypothetical protein
MLKLTNEQIEKIHIALKKIGVLYVDILHEMTDHIASEMEGLEGDFDMNLKFYMGRNKKELRSLNRKNIFSSWRKSYKGLFMNVFSIRFAAFFGLVFLGILGLSNIMEREGFIRLMLFVFIFSNGAVSFPQVLDMIKKKNQYSAGEGLSTLNVFVFFPGLFMMGPIREIPSDALIALYFTTLISICAVMAMTIRQFKSGYKLRYNG